MNLSIALAQMQVARGDFQLNTSRAFDLISQALNQNSDLILFPELWTGGFDYSDCRSYSQANLEFLGILQNTANEKGISIGGSYLVEENGKFFNQFVFLQPGMPKYTYKKIHLFSLLDENIHLSAGDRVCIFATRWGMACLSICYDLRFPEMFRLARQKGAALILMSAGWPFKRIEHWKTLIRARAIENQCFFAAVNCVGGEINFGGSSAIVSPWGETIAEAGNRQEMLVTANIDLEEAASVRNQYPFFDDRLEEYSL